MKLDHITSFLTVTRYGSFHRASEELYIAQSTLTHRIRQLENDLGAELFTRHATGVTVTPAGERFIPVATAISAQLQSYMHTAQSVRPLTIVAGKAFVSYELPRLIGGFRRSQPTFRCYVRSTLLPESTSALLSGAADLAFVGQAMYHPAIEHVSLGDDHVLLICHPHHPWASHFPGVKDWGDQEVIAFGDTAAPFRERMEHFFALSGIRPNIIMELDSISAVKRMVMQDLGVALLPERTVQEEVITGTLVAQDIANGTLLRPTLLGFLRTRQNEPLLQEFITWVRDRY